jgi:Ca2+-binding EF-hand superfamily protein
VARRKTARSSGIDIHDDRQDGRKDSREDIEKVFKLFDDDNTSRISFRNLTRVVEELGENIDDEEMQDMIAQADRDGSGEINFDEFYRIVMMYRGDSILWLNEIHAIAR